MSVSYEDDAEEEEEAGIWTAKSASDDNNRVGVTVAQKTVPMFGHFVMFGL